MAVPHNLTEDGLNSEFQVNYLSHFLLTILLIPALIRGQGHVTQTTDLRHPQCSRVINVSSIMSLVGDINMDDIPMDKFHDRHMAYCNTKLMQVISAQYINKRFLKENLPIRVFSVHPGVVRTNLFSSMLCYKFLLKPVLYICGKVRQRKRQFCFKKLTLIFMSIFPSSQ
jgi:NAD(P)-dependent dehydrogenase (short-subunit alcohol dehydrogenase family)